MTTFKEWLKQIEEAGTSTGDVAVTPQILGGKGSPYVKSPFDCITGKNGKCGLGGKVQNMEFSTKIAVPKKK